MTAPHNLYGMIRQLLFIGLLAGCLFPAAAQVIPGAMGGGRQQPAKIYDGKISGTVTDGQNGEPVEFANIVLYRRGSDKPLDGTVTDAKGAFRLKNIRNGKYRLAISFIGYRTLTIDSIEITDRKPSVETGTRTLSPDSKTLGEVVIREQQPVVESKIDRIVYNADKDLTVKGLLATDVMRRVPLVSVDLDGNVTLQGTSNIQVLINNKPSSIMANSVADALKMISADEIERVEVITSPSAKYDAEGTGGIINIITKKNNLKGLSGSVNASAGTRSSNLNAGLNYRHDRVGTGLSLGGFGFYGNGDNSTVRTTPYSVLTQSGDGFSYGVGPRIQWTGDVDLTSRNNLSASLRYRNFHRGNSSDLDNTLQPTSATPASVYQSSSDNKTDGGSYDASLDYKHMFMQEGRELFLSAQRGVNHRDNDYSIDQYRGPDTLYYSETSVNKSTNAENTLQADYTHPVSKIFTAEAGAKAIFRDVNSDYRYDIFDFASDAYRPDTARSNVFDYSQDVSAAYAQGTWQPGKIGIKAGVRYEYTDFSGLFNKDTVSFGNHYDNWVPSVTVSYKEGAKYNVKLSYTQRIQRPGMMFLNPYVNSTDPLNISVGNPNLEAELSHAFEAGYTLFRKFGSVTLTGYHRFTNNAIESIRFVTANDVYVTTYANIGKNYTTGGSVNGNVLWKKMVLNLNASVYYYLVKTTETVEELSNDGVNYNINLFGSYKFSDRWGVQAFGNFNGPRYSVQGTSTSYSYYSLGARYEFGNKKGGIGMGLDNFASPYVHFRNEYSGKDFNYVSDRKVLFFGVRVSFDYRFGKMEFRQSKKKGGGNDDLKDEGGDQMMGGGR